MATFIPVAVEPSEKTKSAYRVIQTKGEEHWKTVQTKKHEAQKILQETKVENQEPFPVKIKTRTTTTTTTTTDSPVIQAKRTSLTSSSDQESLPDLLQSMIYRTSLLFCGS